VGRWFAVIAGVVFAFGAEEARACSTCAVGDPTLTVMGTGQPFAGRLRLSALWAHRSESVEALEIREERLTLAAAWSPHSRVTLSASMPLVWQNVRYPNLARETALATGDAELRARAVLYRDRALGPRHLLSVVGGLELPTASRRRSHDGQRLDVLQPGTSTWDPIAGVAYSGFAERLSMHVVSTLLAPVSSRDGRRPGVSWRTAVRGQVQAHPRLAVRAGADVRVDGRDDVDGDLDEQSGGAILHGVVGAVAEPVEDLLLQLDVSAPLLERRRGGHDEGWVVLAGVTLDV